MLNDGKPVITPSGDGYDRDLVGHPILQCDENGLRAWNTGYDRSQKGVKDWKLGRRACHRAFAESLKPETKAAFTMNSLPWSNDETSSRWGKIPVSCVGPWAHHSPA
jgi:hypothetical protein